MSDKKDIWTIECFMAWFLREGWKFYGYAALAMIFFLIFELFKRPQ